MWGQQVVKTEMIQEMIQDMIQDQSVTGNGWVTSEEAPSLTAAPDKPISNNPVF